jgi:hypothetical protein
VLATISMWIMWICTYMHQMNPLIEPILINKAGGWLMIVWIYLWLNLFYYSQSHYTIFLVNFYFTLINACYLLLIDLLELPLFYWAKEVEWSLITLSKVSHLNQYFLLFQVYLKSLLYSLIKYLLKIKKIEKIIQ